MPCFGHNLAVGTCVITCVLVPFPLDRLALYGLIVALILSGKTTTAGC